MDSHLRGKDSFITHLSLSFPRRRESMSLKKNKTPSIAPTCLPAGGNGILFLCKRKRYIGQREDM
jgi:hypothetical protein